MSNYKTNNGKVKELANAKKEHLAKAWLKKQKKIKTYMESDLEYAERISKIK